MIKRLLLAFLWCLIPSLAFAQISQDPIAFKGRPAGQDNMYTMLANGTNIALIANKIASPVEWSPNGTKLAYASGSDGFLHYVYQNGTGDTIVPNTTNHDINPSWLNATTLLFVHVVTPTPPVKSEIQSINLDGTNRTAIAQAGDGYFISAPHINPLDGTTLIFESDYPVAGHPFSIYKCPVSACSVFTAVSPTANPAIPSQYADPHWTYDNHILMTRLEGAGGITTGVNVAMMNSDGTSLHDLTTYTCPSEGQDASIDPTDSFVIYEFDSNTGGVMACSGGNNNAIPTLMYTMNQDGTNQQSTGANCSNIGCSPRWNPSGQSSSINLCR